MKRTLIGLAMSSVIGLSACSQDPTQGNLTDATASPGSETSSPVTASNDDQQTAQLKIAVRFPGDGQAQGALIDTDTSVIAVSIGRSVFQSPEQYQALVDNCFSSQFGPDFSVMTPDEQRWCNNSNRGSTASIIVETVVLTPANPTATVDVPVGNYQIYAAQYASDLDMQIGNNSRIAGTKTQAELTAGTHTVNLTFVHGTWDFINPTTGAAQPLQLQLMKNPSVYTALGVSDFDPFATGDQNAAEVLGLAGGDLSGFHLVDHRYLWRYLGEGPRREASDNGFYRDLTAYTNTMPTIFTIPRVVDTAGVDSDVYPRFETPDFFNQQPVVEFEVGMTAGVLEQTYNSIDGNINSVYFADYWVDNWNNDTQSGVHAGIFTSSSVANIIVGATDNGTDYVYEFGDIDNFGFFNNRSIQTPAGLENLIIFSTDVGTESDTHPNTETPLTAYPETVVANGTTITGTLFEVVGKNLPNGFAEIQPSYNGADPIPSTVGPQVGTPQARPAAELVEKAYRLEKVARDSGLKASTASVFGTNCVELSFNGVFGFTDFLWDDVAAVWRPGVNNFSYFYDSFNQVVNGFDLNRNDIIEPFETGVYRNNVPRFVGPQPVFDEFGNAVFDEFGNQVFTGTANGNADQFNGLHPSVNAATTQSGDGTFYATTVHDCSTFDPALELFTCTDTGVAVVDGLWQIDDLTAADGDGDGMIEEYEAALIGSSEVGTSHVCAHEFTLRGRQLDMQIDQTDTTVVIN